MESKLIEKFEEDSRNKAKQVDWEFRHSIVLDMFRKLRDQYKKLVAEHDAALAYIVKLEATSNARLS